MNLLSPMLQRIAERTYYCVHVILHTSPLSDQWSRLRLSFLDVSSQFQASTDSSHSFSHEVYSALEDTELNAVYYTTEDV